MINDHGLYAGRAAAFRCDGGGLRIENNVGTCYLDVKIDGTGPFTVAGSGTICARSTQPFGLGALTVTDTSVLKLGTNIVAGEVTVQSGATLDFSDITADGFAASKFNSLTMQEGSKLKVSGELPDDGNSYKIALATGCAGLDLSKVKLDVTGMKNATSGKNKPKLLLQDGTLYFIRSNPIFIILVR